MNGLARSLHSYWNIPHITSLMKLTTAFPHLVTIYHSQSFRFFLHHHQYLCCPSYREVGHNVLISFTTTGVFSYLITIFIFVVLKKLLFFAVISGLCYTSKLKILHRWITLSLHLLNVWCLPIGLGVTVSQNDHEKRLLGLPCPYVRPHETSLPSGWIFAKSYAADLY